MNDLINCNLYFKGKKQLVSLEKEIFSELKKIAKIEKLTLKELCSLIARSNIDQANFSSAIRVFVFTYYKNIALYLPKGYVEISSDKNKRAIKGSNRR